MSLNIPREIARERVIEAYKRTRRIATAAREAGVTEPTARRWLFDAGLVATHDDRSALGGPGRNVVKGPEPEGLARVDRDPCPRCNVRKDIGCKHFPKAVEPERELSPREQAEALWSKKP